MTHKAIIFDLDGTLIHSAPDLHFAANAALASLGRPQLDLTTIISFIGNGVERLVMRCLEATGGHDAALQAKALELFLETYSKNMTTRTQLYLGVRRALEMFQAAGIPMGICTNKPTAPAQAICDALALTPFFAVIAGAQSGIAKKPDPAPLLACIETLNADPARTLYVGDSAVDYHTARNANVAFRLFSGGYLNDPLTDLSEGDRFNDWTAHGIAFD